MLPIPVLTRSTSSSTELTRQLILVAALGVVVMTVTLFLMLGAMLRPYLIGVG